MDIPTLQTFVTVAETRSFSRAADALHLTQPAVSKRISVLEADLRTRLFDRIGRQVSLTEAGRALLPRARRILFEVEDSRRALSRLAGQVAGPLSVGTSHHIGLHHLPGFLRVFTARHPEVELHMQFMDSEQACRAVERGDLELGVVTLPSSPGRHLQTTLIWPDPLEFVVGHDHPLADRHRITSVQLLHHSAILPAEGTFTRGILEQALSAVEAELSVALSTNYLETIKMMVSIGLGWSVLPKTMLDDSLHILEVADVRVERYLGLVYHRDRTLSHAAQVFVGTLRQFAAH